MRWGTADDDGPVDSCISWPSQSSANQVAEDFDPYHDEQVRADFERKVSVELRSMEKKLIECLQDCGGYCSFDHLFARWISQLPRIEDTLLTYMRESRMTCPKEDLLGWQRLQNSKTAVEFEEYLHKRSHVFDLQGEEIDSLGLFHEEATEECRIVRLRKTTDRGFAQFLAALEPTALKKVPKIKKRMDLLESALIEYLQNQIGNSCEFADVVSLNEWTSVRAKYSKLTVPGFLRSRSHIFEMRRFNGLPLDDPRNKVVLCKVVSTGSRGTSPSLRETVLMYGVPPNP